MAVLNEKSVALSENRMSSRVDDNKRVLTVREFCARYNVGRSTCYQEIAAARLKSFLIGRKRLVRVEDAEAWLAELCKEAA